MFKNILRDVKSFWLPVKENVLVYFNYPDFVNMIYPCSTNPSYICRIVFSWLVPTNDASQLWDASSVATVMVDLMYVCVRACVDAYVYRQSQVRMPNGSGVKWAECSLIIGTGCRVQVFAWSSIAQSVCQRAFSLLEIRFQIPPWVRILHSAEEDNKVSFRFENRLPVPEHQINNSKHVYRQRQVWMPNGSGVEWAECSLIIGTGCRVQVFAWSSIAQSVCQRAFSLLEIRFQRPSGFE